MLEILAIISLVNVNKKNALERGRKPGFFVGLTFALWFGLEFAGFVLGMLMEAEGFGIYLAALLLAAVGGVISYFAAKYCRPGEYVSPSKKALSEVLNSAEMLETPATLEIIRDKSMAGALAIMNLTLNGHPVRSLRNGESTIEKTDRKYNILCLTDAYGNEAPPYTFAVESGGYAKIHFRAGRFRPKATTGTLPVTLDAADSAI